MATKAPTRSRARSRPGRKRIPVMTVVIVAGIAAALGLGGMALMRSGPSPSSGSQTQGRSSPRPDSDAAAKSAYEVVNTSPHDPGAYLQGLLWHDGGFYESTGLYGESTLRRVEFPSGRVVKSLSLAPALFGEGLALVDNRLIQLTWKSQRGFVYDRETFKLLREFTYDTEGWGLTYDGANLIMSDGSSTLTYLNPNTFAPVKKLPVTLNGRPLDQLNELEYIEGEIWANVWQTDLIVRIDTTSGHVNSFLDMAGLLPRERRDGSEDVLNGIAYDPAKKRIFVSGKLWPQIFEIRLK
ncbi:MAG TPA: glutaminyl-peptide cyclotransferase [Blastocatellia bacterium]|nr:glutaminyl-peptide cyclotransferase [Blastocatellia bacterium]